MRAAIARHVGTLAAPRTRQGIGHERGRVCQLGPRDLLAAALVGLSLVGGCSFDGSKLRAPPSQGEDAAALNADGAVEHPADQAPGNDDAAGAADSAEVTTPPEPRDAAEVGSEVEPEVGPEVADTPDDYPPVEDGAALDATGHETGSDPDGGSVSGTGGADGTGGIGGSGGAGGTGGTTASSGGTGGTTTGSGGAGGTDGGTVAPPAGLVAWWKMDEVAGSKVAADASGMGNDATLVGLNASTAWSAGRSGGALACRGLGGALVNDSPSLRGITTGITIAGWVNRSQTASGFAALLSKQIGTGNSEYYWFGMSGGSLMFYGSSGSALANVVVPLGTWTHLAVTHDGATARFYLNGSLVISRNLATTFRADTSKVVICGNQNDSSGSIQERWNGSVDDVQLYDRPLTAAEIAGLAE